VGILDFLRGGSDKDRYARAFELALRAAGERRALNCDAREFSIRVGTDPGRPEAVYYLINGFRSWRAASDDPGRQAVLQRYAQVLEAESAGSREFGQIAPRLMAGVRDRAYLELNRLAQAVEFGVDHASPTLQRPLAADIAQVLLVDAEDSVSLVPESSLASWGVTWDAALAQGLANLRARSNEVHIVEHQGVFAWQVNDSYDAGRILLTGALADVGVCGELVAMVPDRDVLLLAGSEDMTQLRALAAVAQRRFDEGGRLLSGWPLVLRGGQWQLFDPPAEVATEFRRVERRYASLAYRQQSEALQKYLEVLGEDVFVGSWLLESADDAPPGEFTALAVWTEGVETMLPEVDEVVFNGADEVMYRVPWARARAVVAGLMQSTEYFPARWRVDGFPTQQQLLAMGARRVGG